MESSSAKQFVVTVVAGVAALAVASVLIWVLAWAWDGSATTQQVYCVSNADYGLIYEPWHCRGDDPLFSLWIIRSDRFRVDGTIIDDRTTRVLFKVASADQAERRRLGLPATGEVPNGPLARPVK